MKRISFGLVIIVAVLLGAWWLLRAPSPAVAPSEPVLASPSVSVSPGASPNITITSPKTNDTVYSPIVVTGKARVFENQFTVQVKNSSGAVVAEAHVFTDAKDAGQFGNYSVRIPIPAGVATAMMKVEALSYSPKGDGSFEGYAAVPVQLKYTDTMNVYTAFLNGSDCTTVTLFPREITRTNQPMYMSLAELLKGPAPVEVSKGAQTQIPAGSEMNSLRISGDGRTAYVDFNQVLGEGVAGSCRITAIRSEIENTIKQFVGIDTVVISIDGKTEGILQP